MSTSLVESRALVEGLYSTASVFIGVSDTFAFDVIFGMRWGKDCMDSPDHSADWLNNDHVHVL